MSLRIMLRKLLLCFALGGHSVFGLGMSQEKIEELLYAMNQTRVEVSICDQDGESGWSDPVAAREKRDVSTNIVRISR